MSVVVFSPDVVGERMAGPGIRAFFFARELAKRFPVTLIAQLEGSLAAESFKMIDRRDPAARSEMQRAAVVIGQPSREILSLNGRRQALIFDLFDPVVLELQELYGPRPALRDRIHLRREWGRLHAALRRGWFLIAGAPRQRDFYAGVFATVDGVNRGWEERWIEVPFGIEEDDPAGEPAISSDPPVIVWGGGIWPWLDAETAVSAVRELNRSGVTCRLLFLGGSRPNANVPRMDLPNELRGSEILVNEQWVPFSERARWLQPAKIAIMLHHRSLEAEFSIRTRLFDAIWCSLPVVATAGGFAADLVEGEGLGVVVEPSDISAVSNGIRKLLQDDAFYAQSVSNLNRVRERYRWSEVTRPLIRAVEQWVG